MKNNAEIYTYLNTNAVKSFNGNLNYDCCLFYSHDPYIAKNLELLGMKVINSANALFLCENRALMYQKMIQSHLSIPKTFILPQRKVYSKDGIKNFVDEAINELTLPVVIKEWNGTSGSEVYLVKRREDVFAVIDKFKGNNLILQEYISESAGTDVRILVIGEKIVGAVRRQSGDGNFRSNATLGGKVSQYIPSVVESKIAIEATKTMGCNFAVVDILKGVTGSLVCEVNAITNLHKFNKCTKEDIEELLIRECLKKQKRWE